VTAVRVTRVAVLVAAGVLALACDVVVEITADEPGTEATTSGTIAETDPDLELELPAGDGSPCRLLAEVDPALHERFRAGLADEPARGPLVLTDVDGVEVVVATTSQEPGVAGSVAVWQLDEQRIVSLDEVAAGLSDFPLDPIGEQDADALSAAIAGAADCSSAAADHAPPGSSGSEPAMRPELLIVEPAEASAGELLALHFPEETMRGIAFHLDRRDGSGWTTTHLMTSDGNGGEPATVSVATEGYGWEDVGVGGLGPDHVRLPEDVTTGRYRVCTANALDDFCVRLEIAR